MAQILVLSLVRSSITIYNNGAVPFGFKVKKISGPVLIYPETF